jgi:hypothetical protein
VQPRSGYPGEALHGYEIRLAPMNVSPIVIAFTNDALTVAMLVLLLYQPEKREVRFKIESSQQF